MTTWFLPVHQICGIERATSTRRVAERNRVFLHERLDRQYVLREAPPRHPHLFSALRRAFPAVRREQDR